MTGSIYYDSTTELPGQPITFTITDTTTGQVVATFPGTSNVFAICTVGYTEDDAANTQTYTGEAVAPYPACALGTVTIPDADVAVLSASYAGNSTYAGSTSSPTDL